eukprot:CAMPEP_0184503230 /NCGR_PEP_ID=MMETSP0113_2-20130426/51767_1 /TAXON_ID=91329 /ORGANISM="Norrisiella sphaerica, Strain BC52" /LENGTH=603 /DNA_ID=CAMNT_0026892689 /DNA_START=238 /DNA_END=2049 /DNA_ORIENTATION=+
MLGYPSTWQPEEKTARETKSRPRKKYTIRNPRQQWTAEEHKRFVEAIRMYKRDWARVKEHVGTRTVIQIRSHAQKYFLKLQKLGRSDCIPPRRNKIAGSHMLSDQPKEIRKNQFPHPAQMLRATTLSQTGQVDAQRMSRGNPYQHCSAPTARAMVVPLEQPARALTARQMGRSDSPLSRTPAQAATVSAVTAATALSVASLPSLPVRTATRAYALTSAASVVPTQPSILRNGTTAAVSLRSAEVEAALQLRSVSAVAESAASRAVKRHRENSGQVHDLISFVAQTEKKQRLADFRSRPALTSGNISGALNANSQAGRRVYRAKVIRGTSHGHVAAATTVQRPNKDAKVSSRYEIEAYDDIEDLQRNHRWSPTPRARRLGAKEENDCERFEQTQDMKIKNKNDAKSKEVLMAQAFAETSPLLVLDHLKQQQSPQEEKAPKPKQLKATSKPKSTATKKPRPPASQQRRKQGGQQQFKLPSQAEGPLEIPERVLRIIERREKEQQKGLRKEATAPPRPRSSPSFEKRKLQSGTAKSPPRGRARSGSVGSASLSSAILPPEPVRRVARRTTGPPAKERLQFETPETNPIRGDTPDVGVEALLMLSQG